MPNSKDMPSNVVGLLTALLLFPCPSLPSSPHDILQETASPAPGVQQPQLGRRSYAEAVATSLTPSTHEVQPEAVPEPAGPATTAPTSPGTGVGPSGPSGGSRGGMLAAAVDSPRKRSFLGSLKKALAPGSSRA